MWWNSYISFDIMDNVPFVNVFDIYLGKSPG